MRIKKERVLEDWEAIYAQAVISLTDEGLLLEGVKSHTGGRDKIKRLNPAYSAFKDAADALGKLNGWQGEPAQLELDLD